MRRAKPAAPHFLARSVVVDGVRAPYQVFVPAHDLARSAARLPIVLFLHGSGERGDDGEAPLRVGLGPAVRERMESFPALVVFPQAPRGGAWIGTPARAAIAALDAAAAEFGGDPRRTYLSGISMGGFGTWELATEHPDRFAALVPVCAGVMPLSHLPEICVAAVPPGVESPYAYVAARARSSAIWMFHGSDDRSVPVSESRAMARALEAVGARVRYTEYPGVGHNAWDAAYAEPELWSWLFAQRR